MDSTSAVDERLAWVERVLAAPPKVHPSSPDGTVWSTEESCYRLMAKEIGDHSRTLETGAGLSTVLFAAWECDHLAVVPYAEEADAIARYCDEQGIARSSLTFDLRASEVALPALPETEQFDLVFIDGCHGFPLPVVDWFYGAARLRRGGVVVFDDVQLPHVSMLLTMFLEHDPRWEHIAGTSKWSAFRRLSEGPLGEEWFDQPFVASPPPGFIRRAKDLVPLRVKTLLRPS